MPSAGTLIRKRGNGARQSVPSWRVRRRRNGPVWGNGEAAALNGSFPPKADIAAGQDSRNAANPRTNGGVDRSVVGSGLTAVVLTKISQYIRALLIPALAVVLPHDFGELRR